MSIQPHGEDLRKAVKWMAERHVEKPDEEASKLVEEAALQFNLSPADTEFLYRCVERGELEKAISCGKDSDTS
ncbi:MAG: hypothetical protein JRI97_06420 [Deltaproteobacteria bacterium]|nr:hypothetical protein [Deltaproteobacteria bacterium]